MLHRSSDVIAILFVIAVWNLGTSCDPTSSLKGALSEELRNEQ